MIALSIFLGVIASPITAQSPSDRDHREIDRRLAAGEAPAHIIKTLEAAGDYSGRCPDTAYLVDDACRFRQAMALWHSSGPPTARIRRAFQECKQHSQVVINFCGGALTEAVQRDLDAEIASLHNRLAAEDRAEGQACDKGEGPCAIAGHHVEYLEAFHKAWLAYVEARCDYETQYSQGGSGYAQFGTECWLDLAAAHMEQLEKPLES
ncbi:MAG TPA: lysozyme inhibitor LprI family protein [Allosphingosinicella sp.]|nr:lysozyme inhibitor LprI family protein [Allosphingosinicella sp.]